MASVQSYHQVKAAGALLRQLAGAEGSIMYRDEFLTMSAMMAAATGDSSGPQAADANGTAAKWITRYENLVPNKSGHQEYCQYVRG